VRGRENFRDYFADLSQRLLELGIFRGIFLREGGDGRRGFVFVLVERKRASVGRERGDTGLGCDVPQAMFFKLHVADNVWTNRTSGVRQRGTAEAGMKFIGDGGAADLRPALEGERLESGFGEVEGGYQPVVAAADDEDVAGCAHRVYSLDIREERFTAGESRAGSRILRLRLFFALGARRTIFAQDDKG